MHARDLIEFAALLAANGPAIVEHSPRLSESGLEQYWSASKCRHERWARTLRRFSQETQYARSNELGTHWQTIRPVLEEILTSEILTRVWGAICCGYEQRRKLDEASPIVRNVLAAHLEARNRALNLMVYGHGLQVEEAVTLNRMRRRNESWTDVFMGCLIPACDVSEFAFSSSRAADFADDQRTSADRDVAWSLMLSSLRVAYKKLSLLPAPNPDLNGYIVAGILACLPSELFDSTGMIKSLWMIRMQHAASDTQGMIEELLALDERPASAFPSAGRFGLPHSRGTL